MAESSAKRVNDDGGGGGEVPPLLHHEYGVFSDAVRNALGHYDEAMLQRITDEYTVDAQTRAGRTLLMVAAGYGNVASMRFLIERGAAVNIQNNFFKQTALHLACECFMMSNDMFDEMLLLLFRAGADPTLKTKKGDTPRDLVQ